MSNSFKTFLKHTAKDFHNQAVNPPIVRASTIIFKSMGDIRKMQNKAKSDPTGGHFDYGRQGTSTTHVLQKILSKLEESYHTFLTPTGFGAVFLAIFSVTRPGDEIIVADPVYSPTRILSQDFLKEFNIKTTFYNPHDLKTLENSITKKTKLIFVENPGSNTFEFQDIGKVVSIAKKYKILTAIDNTWATPYFLKPIKLGFDMSIVSATKYYSGHSDVMGGSLAVNKKIFKQVSKTEKITGLRLGPDDAYLITRGLRTLDIRLDRHRENAMKVAEFLSKFKNIKLLYPYKKDSLNFRMWKKYYSGASGLMGLRIKAKSKQSVIKFVNNLKLFGHGYSWGGFESLALHQELREQGNRSYLKLEKNEHLVRLHIGLEDPSDLIADIKQALKHLK
ncbi:PLP-dependent aspartate aminotransferase family protein [Candidatus Pelagibacter sp.]|jgi:cystathionine beta-lyase|nr:PLP-dependent aspartate aminotransferase family protein [Candidatus Pelagibacter sp.]MDA8765997.1 PLP-dependent aspartate aminotransferase family protein [Candidatus Pelagibacter bacterium]MDA7813641.1 PLP-dependent aspartate aminotransferase family protein [Candidatus Pelagibacter sp.]MDA9767650.1 PLP-dependent aspartate aminotransferase family protein [Candidatus Pelagibacter sp.]MDA9838178.1 PLP-dependent aspartate aminotransferase family protein [Candidatus Pelagibacter sp.]|tara:strand:+ start:39 stop:1214 length:1176 start_codon:yes stop_codon:yes gene_type:complete